MRPITLRLVPFNTLQFWQNLIINMILFWITLLNVDRTFDRSGKCIETINFFLFSIILIFAKIVWIMISQWHPATRDWGIWRRSSTCGRWTRCCPGMYHRHSKTGSAYWNFELGERASRFSRNHRNISSQRRLSAGISSRAPKSARICGMFLEINNPIGNKNH